MSDGIYLQGVTVDEESADLTFRDIERLKWERMREDCPARMGGYCNIGASAMCVIKDCTFRHWAGRGR